MIRAPGVAPVRHEGPQPESEMGSARAPDKIERLHQSDAAGVVDEELLDEVGYDIHARCQARELGLSRVADRNRREHALP